MIGETVLHYKVEAQLGEGGMSTVYKGLNTKLGKPVAIKVLHPHYARDPSVRERFESEARVQAQLSHPNIVSVHDYHAEGDKLCIIMEFVPGRSLSEVISEETGPMPFAVSIDIMRQVLHAVGYAHQSGLVHRDLKPSNVMIQRFEGHLAAKVMDFGIAKIVGDGKRTGTGTKMGTLFYMSPEQLKSAKDADARSDIYSLGVTLYEMATGRVPFGGGSEYEVMEAIMKTPPPPPSTVYPGVSPALEAVILKAMAWDPSERFQTTGEFLRALEALAASPGAIPAGVTAPTPPPVRPAVSSYPPAVTPGPALTPAPTAKSNAPIIYLAGGAGVLAIILIVILAVFGEKIFNSQPTTNSNGRTVQPLDINGVPGVPPVPKATGWLDITTTPSGAGITIDNSFVGNSPLRKEVAIGNHFVKAEMAGYEIVQQQVSVAAAGLALPISLPEKVAAVAVNNNSNNDPLAIAQMYYDLITAHRCNELCSIRENCSSSAVTSCGTTLWITVDNKTLISNDGYTAQVYVENHGETVDHKINSFRQDLVLHNTPSGWKIVSMKVHH